ITFSFFSSPSSLPPLIYTLSLHDALPIWHPAHPGVHGRRRDRSQSARRGARAGDGTSIRRLQRPLRRSDRGGCNLSCTVARDRRDRKSTRLNSSHLVISYAVFCLKKKKQK